MPTGPFMIYHSENILIVSFKNKTKHRAWYRNQTSGHFPKKKKKKRKKLGPQRKLHTNVQSNFMHNKQKTKQKQVLDNEWKIWYII